MKVDLNIDSYSINDLAKVFNLPDNYDKIILEQNEIIWYQNILKNSNYNATAKQKLYNFLKKAKQKLLSMLESQDEINALYTNTILSSGEHMVQMKHKEDKLDTTVQEFTTDIINPLKKNVIKKVLTIDTRFRENYYATQSTNFNFFLPINFNDVVQMQLASFEIPTSYYAISKQLGNNFFSLIVNDVSTVIEIESGNYTSADIISAINYQISLKQGLFSNIVFSLNLQVSSFGDHGPRGNTGSGKTYIGLIYGCTSVTSISLNFQLDRTGENDLKTPLPLKFGWLLGFRNGQYINNLNYLSEGVLDISGPKYLYLAVDDYNNNVNNNHYSAFNASLLNKNILSRITLNTPTYNILETNNSLCCIPREYFGPVNIKNLGIQLLDEYGRIIDLNNMDYSFTLVLTMNYNI